MSMLNHLVAVEVSKTPVAYFTKEANPRLAKRPLKTNGRLANRLSTRPLEPIWISLDKWINNFILHIIMDVITYQCWDQS